jgi:transposase
MAQTVAIGVDTHKDAHVAVALDALGGELGDCKISSTRAGYGELLAWAQRLGDPVFAVEGCGSYGLGLTRYLAAAGLLVHEAERPSRRDRRRGKNDLIDARLAAGRVLSGDGLSTPRGDATGREQARMLLVERRGARQARTAAINQLRALVITAPDALRERLSGLSSAQLVKVAAKLRPVGEDAAAVLRRTAKRADLLAREIATIDHALLKLVREIAAWLLEQRGVGVVCAAQLIVSSGDPTRMRNDAAFAALAGVSPVDASSGQQQRHRLNRGGDRQLNSALHIIALERVRRDPETIAYYQRLIAAGKTTREALRCVKRALARRFHRLLRQKPLTP